MTDVSLCLSRRRSAVDNAPAEEYVNRIVCSAEAYHLDCLRQLEAESIHIIREVAAEFERPVILYSVGKDSSVLVHLARKAFAPGRIPFPLLHVDTTLKFSEMYAFRDEFCRDIGADLRVYQPTDALATGANPWDLGTVKCCSLLKTQALLNAVREGGFDAALGGARRDEEKSRAKERVFSFRDAQGQWDPRRQRPEVWAIYNGRVNRGESMRVFPMSNWTELDVWQYIALEDIPVVPMYFAAQRSMVVRDGHLIPHVPGMRLGPGEQPQTILCRFRTLGCYPCTGAVRSTAATVDEIVREMTVSRTSERSSRLIDHDQDASMEQKKREGYF
jgi:sulfate adenylyltransferase subunit 2